MNTNEPPAGTRDRAPGQAHATPRTTPTERMRMPVSEKTPVRPRTDPVPRPERVVVVGGVIAEVIMQVEELAVRGGVAAADAARARAGGGYHVLLAARRAGLAAALVGRVGTGPMATLIGRALHREGIEVLLPTREGEQGFTVLLVEPDRTTTRVSSPGVESGLEASDLAQVQLRGEDVVHLSCQDLLDPATAASVSAWVRAGGLGESILVLDPGPLVADVPDEVLDTLLARTDVITVGERELELMSGAPGGVDRDRDLADLADLLAPDAIVLLRLGSGRYVVHERGGATRAYPDDPIAQDRLREVGDLLARLAELRHPDDSGADEQPVALLAGHEAPGDPGP